MVFKFDKKFGLRNSFIFMIILIFILIQKFCCIASPIDDDDVFRFWKKEKKKLHRNECDSWHEDKLVRFPKHSICHAPTRS